MIVFLDGKRIVPYNYFSQIHWGNQEQADFFLNYVKSQETTQNWFILKVDGEKNLECTKSFIYSNRVINAPVV